MKIERFEDIEAWQLARELTRKIYKLKRKPKFAKDYGLKKQIQTAAGSSMHNIAENFYMYRECCTFNIAFNPEPLNLEP